MIRDSTFSFFYKYLVLLYGSSSELLLGWAQKETHMAAVPALRWSQSYPIHKFYIDGQPYTLLSMNIHGPWRNNREWQAKARISTNASKALFRSYTIYAFRSALHRHCWMSELTCMCTNPHYTLYLEPGKSRDKIECIIIRIAEHSVYQM